MENKFIECADCKCNINGYCFRYPPTPKFLAGQWDVKRPYINMDSKGCFAGIPKESEEDHAYSN